MELYIINTINILNNKLLNLFISRQINKNYMYNTLSNVLF